MANPTFEVGDNAIVEVRVVQRLYGQRLLNVFHYLWDIPLGTGTFPGWPLYAELDEGFNQDVNSVISKMVAVQSDDVTYEAVQYQFVHPVRQIYRSFPPSFEIGGIATPAGVSNTAASITLRTDLSGVTRNGRKQLGGIPTTSIEEGRITAAVRPDFVALAERMMVDLPTATPAGVFRPIVYHRSFPQNSKRVVDFIVQSTVRDQRTRTVGQGE